MPLLSSAEPSARVRTPRTPRRVVGKGAGLGPFVSNKKKRKIENKITEKGS